MSKFIKLLSKLAIALSLCLSALPACTQEFSATAQQSAPSKVEKHQAPRLAEDLWWKHMVVYEIYPRSFQDSNGDGVGDINGITSRLDYLHDLGIGAIWITPMYPSPLIDFGYDVSDYTAIDPLYGTLADFDRLVSEAKKRNIRVIMDLVPNHTSDQHPWFKESRSSRNNPKRDWYIWRDGKAPGEPPNNWQSWFGHSAWKFDPATNQYYYHHFYTEQPDLNWRNPEVRKAMYDAMRFWLDRGVAGFRLDAVSRLFEDPDLHDDPILPGKNAYGDPNIVHKYTDNLPEVHEVLREMRSVVDAYPGNPILISEADEPNIAELTKMYGKKNDEVQLPMDFQIADVNKLSAPDFRRLLDEVDHNAAHGQPLFFFSNHDQPRQWDRYGEGVHNDQIAKLMAALLLTTRATPLMYYGEEIGMRTTLPVRKEDVQDPIGKIGWPDEKGRDGERTPMQWDTTKDSGFSSADHPWLPIPPSAANYNVSVESSDPHSILSFYKRLLEIRQSEPALREGSYLPLDRDDPYVLAYLRKNPGKGDSILVVLNMSPEPRTPKLDLAALGFKVSSANTLISAPEVDATRMLLTNFTIAPFGVFIGTVHSGHESFLRMSWQRPYLNCSKQ
jgi:alpha-glucosidase